MKNRELPDAARIIPLEGVLNVRELGGLPLKDGRTVRCGRLIRSGRLSDLTNLDCRILENRWNVTEIVDLRDDQEVREHPDPPLRQATLRRLSLFPGEAAGISRRDLGESPADLAIRRARTLGPGGARRLLEQMYPAMVSQPYCLERLQDFFQLLLSHEKGAFLWHCTSGKDRTGLSCALLLWALGASWDTILADYLFTNRQTNAYRDALCRDMEKHGACPEDVEQIYILESVRAVYLEKCFSMILRDYGSVDRFMETKLNMTKKKTARLRELYVS